MRGLQSGLRFGSPAGRQHQCHGAPRPRRRRSDPRSCPSLVPAAELGRCGAISVRAMTAPTPETEARSSVARHTGEPRMESSRSRSILARACCSQARLGVEVALELRIPGLAAVALGADHLDDLAPAGDQPGQDALGELRDGLGFQRIGLSEAAEQPR